MPSATTFNHPDRLGTYSTQTNSSQSVTATQTFDAFGMQLASTGTPVGPFGFVGASGYQTDVSGLQLLGHRYYDPSTCRFLTRDPAKDGRNWYGYCENNSLKWKDPTGLSVISAIAAGVGSFILATIAVALLPAEAPIVAALAVGAAAGALGGFIGGALGGDSGDSLRDDAVGGAAGGILGASPRVAGALAGPAKAILDWFIRGLH